MEIEVTALGELLIDFTDAGLSTKGNPLLEANPGGAPCNVLSMLSKLGHKTEFIGKVGDDAFGNQLEKALKESGISTKGLKKDKNIHTTLAIVQKLENGDRDFSFYRNPGADMMLNEEEIDEDLIKNCKIFHFGSLSMTDEPVRSATKKAIEIAEKYQKLRSFDPNLREPLWKNLDFAKKQIIFGLKHCDILKISDNEIQWLTDEEDFDKGITWLKENFDIKMILLSLGKDGSRVYFQDKKIEAKAFILENTIETTGAGDTFLGAVLHYILKNGWKNYTEFELKEMLSFANAAAALITTKCGALRVMPSEDEILKLLNK